LCITLIKQGCIRFCSSCFNISFTNATPAARPPGDIVFVALLMRRNPCAAKALSVAHNPLSAVGKEALAAALEQMAREGHGQMQFLACDHWCVCSRRWAVGVGGRRWGWWARPVFVCAHACAQCARSSESGIPSHSASAPVPALAWQSVTVAWQR
jgi:hypothetical protein